MKQLEIWYIQDGKIQEYAIFQNDTGSVVVSNETSSCFVKRYEAGIDWKKSLTELLIYYMQAEIVGKLYQ